jgi:ABC-type branched-subunit amino acid transport system ATPase component
MYEAHAFTCVCGSNGSGVTVTIAALKRSTNSFSHCGRVTPRAATLTAAPRSQS